MKVRFGRRRGEQTLGKIIKLNPKAAKVETLEERGYSNRPIGQVWTVPYSLMKPADGETPNAPVQREPLKYNPFNEDNGFLELILGIYNGLSPENLTADGELPYSVVNQKRAKYNRQLRGLFMALGREVTEDEAYEWWKSKNEYGRTPPAA
jgi:hypothetical protein